MERKWKQALDKVVESVVIKLKRREIVGSNATALQTGELLRTVVSRGKFTTIQELLDLIKSIGKTLTDARPTELAIGNMVRRVLYIIRHEVAALEASKKDTKAGPSSASSSSSTSSSSTTTSSPPDSPSSPTEKDFPSSTPRRKSGKAEEDKTEEATEGQGEEKEDEEGGRKFRKETGKDLDLSLSLHKLLASQSAPTVEYNKPLSKSVKADIMEEIGLLLEEVRTVYLNISDQAVEHIFAKEVILTYGISRTVTAFLQEAAKFRKFEVIVAESAPAYEGQKQAELLARSGIDTTVVTDSAIFAIMRVVNKVLIGPHAVMANGGLLAHTGGHNICMAAKYHSVPVVAVSGLHKLCPLYAFDQDTFNEQNAPSQILKFEEGLLEDVDVQNPAFDYIPPDLVTLLITNFGGHAPSYIYRLLAEYYNQQDYEL